MKSFTFTYINHFTGKIFFFTLIILLGTISLNAQSVTDEVFEKYSGKEQYTSVHITKYMFELFSKITDEAEDKEFHEATKNLTAIKILTCDENQQSFYHELMNKYKAANYQDLMVIKDGKEDVKFMIYDTGDKITELIMLVGGDGDSVLIALQGNIDLKQISKLSKTMNIDGMDHLDNIENRKGAPTE